MAKFKRIFMIVTDGLGIGPDKDQKKFGDAGANTLYSASLSSMFFIDTWKKLGIGNVAQLEGNYHVKSPLAYVSENSRSFKCKRYTSRPLRNDGN
nr:hypothetical protein [Mycoplasmopsis bovis]